VGGARYGVKIRFPHALIMTLLFHRTNVNDNGIGNNHHGSTTTTTTATLLDRAGQKLRHILKLTYAHASRLAVFAAGYKTGLFLLKWAALQHWQRRRLESANDNNKQSDGSPQSLGETLLGWILYGSTRISHHHHDAMTATTAPGMPLYKHHALLAGALSASLAWGRNTALNYQVLLYVASRVLVGTWKRLYENDNNNNDTHPRRRRRHHHPPTTVAYRLFTGLIWGTAMLLFEESPHTLPVSMVKSMKEIYRFHWPTAAAVSSKDVQP